MQSISALQVMQLMQVMQIMLRMVAPTMILFATILTNVIHNFLYIV